MRSIASKKNLRFSGFVSLLLLGVVAAVRPAAFVKTMAAAHPERVRWVPARDGERPYNAIRIGRERHGPNAGEMLYVCRASHLTGIHPGKLIGSACNIGYGGSEVAKSEYEVAVYSGGSWRVGDRGGALVGGFENNDNLYVCRIEVTRALVQKFLPTIRKAHYGLHGGKLLADGLCHVGYAGQEIISGDYELFYP
jgi:hypothetical protein